MCDDEAVNLAVQCVYILGYLSVNDATPQDPSHVSVSCLPTADYSEGG